MKAIVEKIGSERLSRRTFVSLAAGTAALCGLGLSGCSVSETEEPGGEEPPAEEGKWVTAICWHNCGGRCLNRCYVVDGMVMRQKTDDTHEDSPDFPQQRACARGRSNRNQVFSPDRIKYPLKRKNWQPGGGDGVNGHLRGIDEWERISWDEAIEMVASEIKRITETYGPTSIFALGTEIRRVLLLNGGYSYDWGPTSFGTWDTGASKFGGFTARTDLNINNKERTDQNDRFEMRNAELIVEWGQNCSWSGAGNPTYYFLAAKRAGAKFVFIDPYYNNTMQALDAEWIPIRPGTDHTMVLGMMHTILTEDDPETNPLIDWDFLKRCTVGFTEDNMPEGADPSDAFQNYVLGVNDGVPKTPEWASEICGVDPETIKDLARRIATTERVSLQSGYAPARTNNQDSWPQAFMTLGWMCGHVGKSGCMTGTSCRYSACNGGPELVVSGSQGVPAIENENAVTVKINRSELWNSVLSGTFTAGFEDIQECNIKMIYHSGSASLNQIVNIKTGVEAHRAVECVVTNQYSYNTEARYSDIILPVCTRWELFGDFGDGANRKKEATYYGSQICEPLYESKNDYWIAEQIADKLGFDGKLVNPLSIEQRMFNALATITVVNADNTGYEPLIAITEDDIASWGVEGTPQEGRISLAEFVEAGTYQVPRSADDPYKYIAHEAFRNDPEANPLPTESGKFEIYCSALKEHIHSCGWSEIDAFPSYNRPVEGYEDTFSDWENKVKGEYPLQFYTIHYPRRGHSNFDNVPWLREAFPQEVIMNASDAAALGIGENDVVMLESKHGQVVRHVHVTERMMPGVVTLGQGAWLELDEETGIDKAGNVNMLNGPNPTGQGHIGFNTCIIKVKKSDMQLDPDYTWPTRIDLEWEA